MGKHCYPLAAERTKRLHKLTFGRAGNRCHFETFNQAASLHVSLVCLAGALLLLPQIRRTRRGTPLPAAPSSLSCPRPALRSCCCCIGHPHLQATRHCRAEVLSRSTEKQQDCSAGCQLLQPQKRHSCCWAIVDHTSPPAMLSFSPSVSQLGNDTPFLLLHGFCLLPGKTQSMSSVGLLPPLGCQNGVQNSRSQRQNPYHCHLCWASYWYQKKDLKFLGITLYLSFKLMAVLDLAEWMVTMWYTSATCRHSQESSCDIILHLFRDYSFCMSCNTTTFEKWLWQNSGQVLLCHVERDGARQPAAQAISPAKWGEKLVETASPVKRQYLLPYLFSSP